MEEKFEWFEGPYLENRSKLRPNILGERMKLHFADLACLAAA